MRGRASVIDILICNEMDAIPIAALYKELMTEIIVKTVGDEQLVLEVATPQLPEFERSLAFMKGKVS